MTTNRQGIRGSKARQNLRIHNVAIRPGNVILTAPHTDRIRLAENPQDIVILTVPQTDRIRLAENRYGKLAPKARQTYRERIAELREYGVEDDVTVNPASEKDFWAFVKSLPAARPGSLVLMDNGNLRAVWKGDQGSHLGLQFLGRQMVEYVIFKRRPRAKQVSRVAGADTFDGIKRQIDAFELSSLLV